MILEDLTIGSIWQHYKQGMHYGSPGSPTGGRYRIVLLGRDETSGMPAVAYQGLDDNTVWFRSVEDFLAIVTDAGGSRPRFKKLCESHNMNWRVKHE